MDAITINLPAKLHERLKRLAAQNRRSMRNEIVLCLERHAKRSAATKEEQLARVARLHTDLPEVDHRIVDSLKRTGRA